MAVAAIPGVERVLSSRQLTPSGIEPLLRVIYRREGHLVAEPFERETASTLFVDEPVAVFEAARADDLFFDILNSIDTAGELHDFVRECGVLHDGGPSLEILAAVSLHRCRRLL